MARLVPNPNFSDKEILSAAQKKGQKITANFINEIKCPVCGKSPVMKSAEGKQIGFDCCHIELEEAIKKELEG